MEQEDAGPILYIATCQTCRLLSSPDEEVGPVIFTTPGQLCAWAQLEHHAGGHVIETHVRRAHPVQAVAFSLN